ncbi:MAG: hypothetical protein ACR2F6_05760 [Mycobacteriales bacterium]
MRPLQDAESYWLLVRRNLTDPTDLAYYLCHGPEHTRLRERARCPLGSCALTDSGGRDVEHLRISAKNSCPAMTFLSSSRLM